jgi:hypothetical protein
MLSVTNKPFMLSLLMLNVVMMSVVMLSVVAPLIIVKMSVTSNKSVLIINFAECLYA